MKYPFYIRNTRVDGKILWIAQSSVFRSLKVQGPTIRETLAEFEDLESRFVATNDGWYLTYPINPLPTVEDIYGNTMFV